MADEGPTKNAFDSLRVTKQMLLSLPVGTKASKLLAGMTSLESNVTCPAPIGIPKIDSLAIGINVSASTSNAGTVNFLSRFI